MPPNTLQEKGPEYLATHPVGTGPYKFVKWVKDDELVLEAFDNYWRGTPKIKRVIFKPIPEATTRVASLQTQEADIIVNVPPHLIEISGLEGKILCIQGSQCPGYLHGFRHAQTRPGCR